MLAKSVCQVYSIADSVYVLFCNLTNGNLFLEELDNGVILAEGCRDSEGPINISLHSDIPEYENCYPDRFTCPW